jgi:ATP-dependent Lon protease
MAMNDLPDIINFMDCCADTLPPNIRRWARKNIVTAGQEGGNPDEKRHAKRALTMMLNIRWKSSYFDPIDPMEARRILDEELYGLRKVKQRVIETIIQINRTHTLPSYGLLLAGPAGTGKSQIAYAVARILKIPFAVFDMSTVRDPEALSGTSRIYSNARPGRIMEAFSATGSSNIVFVINELDKANRENQNGNPADTLLTLLDNLGFTDNYMECQIPTGGVYPIATANEKDRISEPLISRFAVIDIPDYTPEEKKIIFRDYSLPKVLRRMGMRQEECTVLPDAVDTIIGLYRERPGCRDLEQAAEHLAGNALYEIETKGLTGVHYDAEKTLRLLRG